MALGGGPVVGIESLPGRAGRFALPRDEAAQHREVELLLAKPATQAEDGVESRDVSRERVRIQCTERCARPRRTRGRLVVRRRHRRLDPGEHRRPEIVRFDRFGDVRVHPRREAPIAVRLHRIRRHRDDREVLEARVTADLAGGRHAVHHRHLHVHQHDVVPRSAYPLERHQSVLGQIHHEAGVAQQFAGHALVHIIVLHEQYARALEARESTERVARRIGAHARPLRDPAQEPGDAVEERRGAHRLHEDAFDADLFRPLDHLFTTVRRDHQQMRLAWEHQRPDLTRRLDPVDPRHLPVEEDDRVRTPLPVRAQHGGDRGQPIRRLVHRERERTHKVSEHRSCAGVVVHHERAHPALIGGEPRRQRRRRAHPEARGEPEGAPHPRHTLHPHLPTHQLGEVLGDDEAESRASEATRGRGVRLREALEEPSDLLRRQPDPRVAHGVAQQDVVRRPLLHTDRHRDLAVLGELHRIVAEVDEDLAQPQRVAHQHERHVLGHIEDEFESLRAGLGRDE